jgi:hypothetical protein
MSLGHLHAGTTVGSQRVISNTVRILGTVEWMSGTHRTRAASGIGRPVARQWMELNFTVQSMKSSL